jgi:hypothetical protein
MIHTLHLWLLNLQNREGTAKEQGTEVSGEASHPRTETTETGNYANCALTLLFAQTKV